MAEKPKKTVTVEIEATFYADVYTMREIDAETWADIEKEQKKKKPYLKDLCAVDDLVQEIECEMGFSGGDMDCELQLGSIHIHRVSKE